MTNRERLQRILHYESADRMPVVHFGFWRETLQRWAEEGHISRDVAEAQSDGNAADMEIAHALGFDFNYHTVFAGHPKLSPPFESKVVEEFPDGSRTVLNGIGVVLLEKPGAGSIPADVDHLLKDRAAWEEHYRHRIRFRPELIEKAGVPAGDGVLPFGKGGKEFLMRDDREYPIGFRMGSLYGEIRNWLTMEGACYMMVDDEELFTEIIDTVADLTYQAAEYVFETGVKFDFAHFWEDICFKSGPLITPSMFAEKVGPHYKRLTELAERYGCDIVSVDSDGCIDALLPIWLENGVNTMFPIEVGTWHASIAPWRGQYGRELRGVGGTDKKVFAADRSAVDAEIERLKPLVELGGYIPCPDHRISPDAAWDNVRHYCDRMRAVFG